MACSPLKRGARAGPLASARFRMAHVWAALDHGGGASDNGAMTLPVHLPISFDPLLAEAKRRMRKRRLLLAVLIVASAVSATLALRAPGTTPAGRNSAPVTRLALRVHGQGVLSVGKTRLRCISQAASEIVCKDTASVRRRSAATLRERPRPGWHFVNWSGACQGARATCHLPRSRVATVAATFHRR
jgi:hypothetical protein